VLCCVVSLSLQRHLSICLRSGRTRPEFPITADATDAFSGFPWHHRASAVGSHGGTGWYSVGRWVQTGLYMDWFRHVRPADPCVESVHIWSPRICSAGETVSSCNDEGQSVLCLHGRTLSAHLWSRYRSPSSFITILCLSHFYHLKFL